MAKRLRKSPWARLFERQVLALGRSAAKSGARALGRALRPAVAPRRPAAAAGSWLPGVAIGAAGARRYRLYRPPDHAFGERLPLLVMLHGCGQDAQTFAASTRMNRIAQRERFMVLYPEQDRLANGSACWNWFDTDGGRAWAEAALIMKAIDQVCLLHAADRSRVAIAGLSAGASMAALLATRHPERFRALVMHSGVPPGSAHSTLSALRAMHGRRGPRPLVAAAATKSAAWPPLLVIHGQADGVVAPNNGRAAVQAWADAAGAAGGPPRSMQRGRRYPMAVTDYKRRGRTVARLVEVGQLAHAWSGGAAGMPFGDGRGPDASRMAWAFVARQLRD